MIRDSLPPEKRAEMVATQAAAKLRDAAILDALHAIRIAASAYVRHPVGENLHALKGALQAFREVDSATRLGS